MPKSDHGQELFRLVYVSRAVLPVLAKFEATVQEILPAAQANNAQMDVTGLLVAHRGWFIQALEGPRRNVSMIFGAIGRDFRHAQIELLEAGPIGERMFSDWSLCAHSIAPDAAILDELDLASDFDPFRMDGPKALALMQAVARAKQLQSPTA
jgi:hypothetical protein